MYHWRPFFLILLCAALVSCSSQPKVTRMKSGEVTDLSGRWNDTDSRLVSETMVKELLAAPWYADRAKDKDAGLPVVIVGRIANETMEHINAAAFVADFERALINSGKIAFVAGGKERDAVRLERLDQLSNASEETIKEFGREIGADYMLFGTIASFTDQSGGTKVVSYQIDCYLVDVEKNLKVWAGQRKIKKEIKRRRFSF